MRQYVTRLHHIRQKLNTVVPKMTVSDDFFAWVMLRFARLSEEERSRVLTTTRLSFKITKVQNALVKLFPERQRFSRDEDDGRGAARKPRFRDDRCFEKKRDFVRRFTRETTDDHRSDRRQPPRGDGGRWESRRAHVVDVSSGEGSSAQDLSEDSAADGEEREQEDSDSHSDDSYEAKFAHACEIVAEAQNKNYDVLAAFETAKHKTREARKSRGHVDPQSREYKERKAAIEEAKRKSECHICGETGHWHLECPKAKEQQKSTSTRSFKDKRTKKKRKR